MLEACTWSTQALWLAQYSLRVVITAVSQILFLTIKCPCCFVYFFYYSSALNESIFWFFFFFLICKHNIVFLFMRDVGAGNRLLHCQQQLWTYWASSRMRIGWGRLWWPPHRKVAGETGSGRSVRKTGHMAPSVTSGCCLSDCFLETDTYIHIQTQRRGEKENWAGYLKKKKKESPGS